MSSLKMTFSLASLVLIFALAFYAMPAMAADGWSDGYHHISVTIPKQIRLPI